MSQTTDVNPPESVTVSGASADRMGVIASGACAVHCALTPILIPLLPIAIGHAVSAGSGWSFRVVAGVLGVAGLWHSYGSLHRQALPLMLFGTGMTAAIMSGVWFEGRPTTEACVSIAGAVCMVSAHLLNLRLRRQHRAGAGCPCPCHDADDV